ncbi:MAG: GTP 3',8-cyclase MoaA [Betaproteobacteria bacterium]|nr:GTP 3',8-cyclase MoaA [Betaproteobacteria bacterium]
MVRKSIPIHDLRASGPIPAATGECSVPTGSLHDLRGRRMRDLRISVTDRCNFRCIYCMPKEVFDRDYQFLPRDSLLSFEEIVRVARLFVGHGVSKIRLTGGEPLLRRNIEHLVEMLAAIPGIEITLTTNGVLLPRKAQALRDAGLDRITVSLDSLDEEVFRRMNDMDYPVSRVLEGIEAARAAGFHPIKINAVVKASVNRGSILPLAGHFRESGHIVRFIEFMDVGATNGWCMDEVVPSSEVVRIIDAEFPLQPVDPNYTGEVAERWRYRDGGGEIGVISSVTQAFCGTCTRVRLSTEGKLYTCLYATQGHDMRALLRSDRSDAEIASAIGLIWQGRSDRYSEIRTAQTAASRRIEMSYIGG